MSSRSFKAILESRYLQSAASGERETEARLRLLIKDKLRCLEMYFVKENVFNFLKMHSVKEKFI